VTYNFIISWVGLFLEEMGFVRLHALSVKGPFGAVILWGPSGIGKSSLAYLLMKEGDFMYADEVTLVKGPQVFSFPLRLALRSEVLVSLGGGDFNHRRFERKKYGAKVLLPFGNVAEPAPLHRLYLLYRPTRQNHQLSLSLPQAVKFAWSVFWGLELCQMSEFILTISFLDRLLKVAWWRFSFLISLFWHSTVQCLEVSREIGADYLEIRSIIRESGQASRKK
jgi:hypothetical protein